MRGFIVLCLSAVALAAPEGYSYSQQQLSSGGGATGLGGSFQGFGPVATSSLSSSANFHGSGSHQQQQFQQPIVFNHASSSNTYGSQQQQQGHPEPVVSKRFFLHAAPEENDDEYREKHITVGTPRKNYNVVFIKAPAKGTQKTSVKITPAINEEKTVIYVLSKKADAAEVHAEVQELPSSTAKPEVFFIKYKTPEEAAHAQQEIKAQYDSLGGSSQLTDEGFAPVTSVIGSLGNNNNNNGDYHGDQSANFGQVQQVGNGNGHGNGGYLPPNFH